MHLNFKSIKRSLLIVVLGLTAIKISYSQIQTISYHHVFSTTNQSMWYSGDNFNLNRTYNLFDPINWNTGFSTGDAAIVTILGEKFGVALDADLSGGIGMRFESRGFESGNIDVSYPVDIALHMPDIDAFNPGEEIRITSGYVVAPGYQLLTTFPQAGVMEFLLDLYMSAKLDAKACFFSCASSNIVDGTYGYVDQSVFRLTQSKFEMPIVGYEENLLPLHLATKKYGLSGDFDLPNVSTTFSLDNKRLVANGESTYLTINFDAITFMGDLGIPYASAFFKALKQDMEYFSYALFSTDFNFHIANTQEFIFDPDIYVRLNFPIELSYKVMTTAGIVLESNTSDHVVYKIGNDLILKFPCDYDFMDLTPTFSLTNEFTNHTYDHYGFDLLLAALQFEIDIPSVTIIPEICIDIPFVGEECTPSVEFDGYHKTMGPAWSKTVPIFGVNADWYENSWELQGFTDKPSGSFRIQPRKPQMDVTAVDAVCYGSNTGEVTLIESGLSGPLTYKWSNGATSSQLNNVTSGEYYVAVTDKNGCVLYGGATVHEPEELESSINSTNILCYNQNIGIAEVKVDGGVEPYNYVWSNGSTTKRIENLPAGKYYVTVFDDHNCTIEDSVTITEPTELICYISDFRNPTCFSSSDGSIKMNISGGTPPYSILWSNYRTQQNIDSLDAGNYSVTVTDYNGCSSSTSVSLTKPELLTANLSVLNNVSCYNGNDGRISVDIQGGTQPYFLNWYSPLVNLSTQNTLLENIEAGHYLIRVTDEMGCEASDSIKVTSPSERFSSELEATHLTCFNGMNGSIDLTVFNGTPPYTYQWSNGEVTKDIDGLPAGNYEVIITDNLNCETENNTVLLEPDRVIVLANVIDVSCKDEHDGEIGVTAMGGNAPYIYYWDNGETTSYIKDLEPGTYGLHVEDYYNCVADTSFEVGINGVNCIAIPNTFTPNGDGKNDIWKLSDINLYPNCYVQVFTKWGKIVFTSNGYNEPWDGKYKGSDLPVGTYYYIIDLGIGENELTGSVTIVR